MEFQTTDKDVLQTGMYKDDYQIKSGYYKNGDFKVRSMKIVKKDGTEAFPPVSVNLGNRDKAVAFLLAYLKEITGDEYAKYNEDMPF